jgi:hypothetical protein
MITNGATWAALKRVVAKQTWTEDYKKAFITFVLEEKERVIEETMKKFYDEHGE